MQWIGWGVAVVAIVVAVWLWRKLASERAHAAQLLYARIEAENQAEQMRSIQERVLRVAHQAALGGVLDDVVTQIHEPLSSAHAGVEQANRLLADYRELVKRYDAAVQYCLQPVELIFGADKASLDQLVQHVEGARRKLFDARAALEKHAVHGPDAGPLRSAASQLQPLAELASGLRAFSSRGRGSDVDVNACIDAVLRTLAPRFGDRIQIARDLQPLPVVRGSAAALHEILLHLLDNAARSIAGEGKITVATRSVKGGVEIVVGDSGTGIAEDALPHVFDAFFTTRAEEGAPGLGLTFAREYVSVQGGDIDVRSIRGHGATFTVTLPLEPIPAPADPDREAATAASQPGWANTEH